MERIITVNDVDVKHFIQKNEIRDRLSVHYKIMKQLKNNKNGKFKRTLCKNQ